MQFYPNLTFNGDCEAAFRRYAECLGGKIVFMMAYGDAPTQQETPPEWRKKIYHATFEVGDQRFSGSDLTPGQYQKLQGFAMQLDLNDAAEADRIFRILAENGEVHMPLQETSWAARFGVLVDPFGIRWLINCEEPA